MNRRIELGLPSLNYYQTLFYVYLTVALTIFTFLVPPFQKSDEPAHFHRSVSITNLDFVCNKDANGQYYFLMKRKYADLPDVLHTWDVAFRYQSKFKIDWLRADFSDPIYDQSAPVYRFCSLPIPGYLPNALGVLLGKPFANPLVSFYSGRLFGALFFVLAVVLALRIVPGRYKLLVYFYAAMPMVLHQVSAISYDAVQLSLFPLVFAYLTKFLVEDSVIRPRNLLIFMALLWWLVNIRLFAYYPILLLFFLIDSTKISSQFSRYLLATGAFLVIAGLTTAFFDLVYLPLAADSAPEGFGIDASSQVRFVIEHPWHFLAASYKTLHVQGDLLLRELIGVFGWIDYGFNVAAYYMVVFIAGVVFYFSAEKDVVLLRLNQLSLLLAVIVLTVASLFFSLYAVWSPVGSDTVSGLQGRYFIGLLPFTMLLCSQGAVTLGPNRLLRILVLIVGIVLIFNIFRAVELRYY